MDHRVAEAMADMNATVLKEKIDELKKEVDVLTNEINIKESELKRICPHIHTKTEHGEITGDYYNKGTYYSVETCVLCGKEIDRTESPSSYG